MADINYEELEDLTLTMEDEDGTTTECELQFVFEYDGQDYGAFCEAENETGEFYFFSIDFIIITDNHNTIIFIPEIFWFFMYSFFNPRVNSLLSYIIS